MKITTGAGSGERVQGIPRKPLDNPPRPKPTYQSDDECARLLDCILRQLPKDLRRDRRSPFPLLTALFALDELNRAELAKQLIFVAAVGHRAADERRTAEYLLRNRELVISGQRSAYALLDAARCAAEMDVRRVQSREIPTPNEAFSTRSAASTGHRSEDPSVGEVVLDTLLAVTNHYSISALIADRILDAVAIALELAHRHVLNGGQGPSLLGMRSDARRDARLVTHLRDAFGNDVAARSLARLLVGADGTPLDSALLWWSARRRVSDADVPTNFRDRWIRYLRTADAALRCSNTDDLVHRVFHRRAPSTEPPTCRVPA